MLNQIGAALNEDGDVLQFPRIVAAMSAALAHSRRTANECGILLAVQWAAALTAWIWTRAVAAAIVLGVATAVIAIYLWLRRAGLRAAWRRFFGTRGFSAREQE